MCNFIGKALLVDRSDLLQQYDRIAIKAMYGCVKLDMRWKLSLLNLRCYRCYNDCRAEAIAYIVLNDEDRPDAALLRANNR